MIQTVQRPNDEPENSSATTYQLTRAPTMFPDSLDEDTRPRLRIGQTSVMGDSVDRRANKTMDSKIILLLGLLLAASGLVSSPPALVGGIAYRFTVEHPLRREASSLARLLLQLSVILLGFGMNLNQVIHAGKSGFLYTAISITFAVALGILLGKLLRIRGKAGPAGGNPILGTWKLVDTNMASVCRAERVFVTYKEATARHEVPAIYVVNPTYVEVSYGGANIEEWE